MVRERVQQAIKTFIIIGSCLYRKFDRNADFNTKSSRNKSVLMRYTTQLFCMLLLLCFATDMSDL